MIELTSLSILILVFEMRRNGQVMSAKTAARERGVWLALGLINGWTALVIQMSGSR